MILYDRIFGFLWLILGAFIVWSSYRLNLGEAGSPGPGFIPFLTGCLLIFLSAIFLAKSLFFSPGTQERKGFWEGVQWDKPAWVAAAMFVYVFLLPVLGFLVSTFLFLIFLGRLIRGQRWHTILIVSALSAAVTYLVFGIWLKCQFPRGILF